MKRLRQIWCQWRGHPEAASTDAEADRQRVDKFIESGNVGDLFSEVKPYRCAKHDRR